MLGKGLICSRSTSPGCDGVPLDGLVIAPTGQDSHLSVYMAPVSIHVSIHEIVNLMSVDAQRLQDMKGYLWMV